MVRGFHFMENYFSICKIGTWVTWIPGSLSKPGFPLRDPGGGTITHMAEFGENYRAGYDAFLCPLCLEHLDNQQNSLKCKSIQDELEFKKNVVRGFHFMKNYF